MGAGVCGVSREFIRCVVERGTSWSGVETKWSPCGWGVVPAVRGACFTIQVLMSAIVRGGNVMRLGRVSWPLRKLRQLS